MGVVLRAIRESDLEDYVRWLNDPEVTEYTVLEAGHATLEGERDWFHRITSPENPDRNWAIAADGRHIGNCRLHLEGDGRIGAFGIIIGDKTAWNRGYGTSATKEVLRVAFAEMKLHRVFLCTAGDNARAIRCYEKSGFRHEGRWIKARWKRGEWRDTVWMAILRKEWEEARDESERGVEAVQIRSYRPADHSEVLAIWEAAGWHNRPSDSVEAIERKLRLERGPFLVAEAEGRVVGTVMGHVDRNWGWVNRLAVHPEWQRRGVARRLMAEAERSLRELGATTIHLLTHEGNAAALGLYEALGYRRYPQIVYMNKDVGVEDDGRGGH